MGSATLPVFFVFFLPPFVSAETSNMKQIKSKTNFDACLTLLGSFRIFFVSTLARLKCVEPRISRAAVKTTLVLSPYMIRC